MPEYLIIVSFKDCGNSGVVEQILCRCTNTTTHLSTLIDILIFISMDNGIRRLVQKTWAVYKSQREVGPATGTINKMKTSSTNDRLEFWEGYIGNASQKTSTSSC